MTRLLRAGTILASCIVFGPAAGALEPDAVIALGKAEYMENCAACHGASAKGYGPAADAMAERPSDLTAISAEFGGTFPTGHIYSVIDGRESISPHGDRDMPIWGYRYWDAARERAQEVHLDVDAAAMVHGRITALVAYLESIQTD